MGPCSRDHVVAETIKIIHRRPDLPWSVVSLADEAGVSPSTLSRRFQTVTGTSPIAYLNQWRLSLAADLLRDTDLTLSSIATRVGYANPFSLSAAFKRQFGLSPAQYRG